MIPPADAVLAATADVAIEDLAIATRVFDKNQYTASHHLLTALFCIAFAADVRVFPRGIILRRIMLWRLSILRCHWHPDAASFAFHAAKPLACDEHARPGA
jgi:hypothetical protein